MDKQWIMQNLPEKVREGMLKWQKLFYDGKLGPEYLVFRGVRTRWVPKLEDMMYYNRTQGPSVWAAECNCTECGEVFLTAGGGKSVWLANGEDGMAYTIDPDFGMEESDVFCDKVEYDEGEEVSCPYCQSRVQLIHASHIRGGRTKRIMVESVERIGDYVAILYWMIERHIEEYGSYVDGFPMAAYVLDENKRIHKFRHGKYGYMGTAPVKLDGWEHCSGTKDCIDNLYGDWGSINSKKQGAIVWKLLPRLDGSTGEKTGLKEIVEQGETEYLLQYLNLWRHWPQVENVVKAGFANTVAKNMTLDRLGEIWNLRETKPHRILGVTRNELREHGNWLRSMSFSKWAEMKTIREKRNMDLGSYRRLYDFFGWQIGKAAALPDSMDKTMRYLKKQNMHGAEVDVLADYRLMIAGLHGRELTQEELWPKRLMEAHDRVGEQVATLSERKKMALYAEGFREVKDKYGCLEWTDGELAILLPMSNGDLIREGKILRHCVGGYGDRHIHGEDTIFFVRHYRRPERPYYTLDICMTGKHPKEIQLHGYGNERHGAHKQYSHRIPQKVRDFCDRWENEVLMPWAAAQTEKEKRA